MAANLAKLPNAFFDFDVYQCIANADGITRKAAKRRAMSAPYGKRKAPAKRKGSK